MGISLPWGRKMKRSGGEGLWVASLLLVTNLLLLSSHGTSFSEVSWAVNFSFALSLLSAHFQFNRFLFPTEALNFSLILARESARIIGFFVDGELEDENLCNHSHRCHAINMPPPLWSLNTHLFHWFSADKASSENLWSLVLWNISIFPWEQSESMVGCRPKCVICFGNWGS